MIQTIRTTASELRLDLLVQQSIERLMEEIANLGYFLAVDDDMAGLQKYLLKTGAYPNPSFDPTVHDLSSNAFWLRVEDGNGCVVASHAERVFACANFVEELIETDRIWFADGIDDREKPWRTEITRPPVSIQGRIGYAGGMFIQPEHRGSGLALFLPYLSRSLCLRNFQTDWHTGLIHLNIASSPVPKSCYGYPRTARIFDGRCPRTTGTFKEVHLCWMDRAESIEKLYQLPTHPRYPVDLPLINQAA